MKNRAMQNWMQALAAHYERTRATFVRDDLLILFDIDGTILDSRYMLLYLLQAYDRNHNTGFFTGCRISDMNFSVAELEAGLRSLGVPADHFAAVRAWYDRHRWSMAAVLEAHRPFPGVMDVLVPAAAAYPCRPEYRANLCVRKHCVR